ncbi:MAG: ice-binding family protein [bacterium]|nr:ice-binding family protein [bacterium]
MKTKLLKIATVVALLSGPNMTFAQAPTLGTAANFVLFSSNGAVTNVGPSHITGNVGTNSGSSTGFGNVNGVMSDNNVTSSVCATDLLTAYNQLNATVPAFFPSSTLGGTLTAGVYSISAASVLNGTLTLNAQGNANAVFIFQISGSLSTGAGALVILQNSAKACNVFWKVEGLVSMAAGTIMKGTVIANNAAINLSSGVKLEGRALSTTGGVTVNNVLAYTPIGCGSPFLTGPATPTLGSIACFELFSSNGAVTNSGVTTVVGDIGTNVGLTTGFNALNVTGAIHPIPDGVTSAAAADLLTAYGYLNTLPYDIELLYPAQFGNQLVLTPHTYLLGGAVTFVDTLFLDGQTNPNAVFVIKVNGAFSTGTYANVVLMNGTQSKNVFWKIEGAININNYSNMKGTFIVNNGAVLLNPNVNLDGRALTTNGSFGTSAMTASLPLGAGGSISIAALSNTLCAGRSTTLTASGALTYTWSTSVISNSIVVSPTVTSTYSAVGTSTSAMCSNSAIRTISVSQGPTISVNSGSLCAGTVFTLVPTGAVTYTFSSGTSTILPISSTSYSITGTNSLGCISALAAIATVTVNAIPVISVNSGTICAGSIFTITPGGASTYTITGGSATVSPIVNSSYSVTGTSSAGCVSLLPAVSSVNINSVPIITVNSGAVCLGTTFTMIPGGASTYTFSSGSNTVIPTVTTTYSVTGTNSLGCIGTGSAISSVTVNALPLLTVNSGSICANQVFTMIPAGALTYSYSSGTNTVSPSITSNYSITGTNSLGCVSAIPAVSTVTVIALPIIAVNNGTICSGKSFIMTPTGAISYTYSSGSATVSPLVNTSYTVSGTNSAGCVSSAGAVSNVTVFSLPIISVNSGQVCSGNSFTMIPTGAFTYTYSSGSNVVTPITKTSYSVTGTSAQGCVSALAAISTVTVNPSPVVNVVSSTPTSCAGQAVVLIASGAAVYAWSNGQSSSTNTITPTLTVSYTVTGKDNLGCLGKAVYVQTVIACTNITELAVNSSELKFFPNPNNGSFNVEVSAETTVTLFNSLGQIVLVQVVLPGVTNFEQLNLQAGIYYISAGSTNNVKAKMIVSGN